MQAAIKEGQQTPGETGRLKTSKEEVIADAIHAGGLVGFEKANLGFKFKHGEGLEGGESAGVAEALEFLGDNGCGGKAVITESLLECGVDGTCSFFNTGVGCHKTTHANGSGGTPPQEFDSVPIATGSCINEVLVPSGFG